MLLSLKLKNNSGSSFKLKNNNGSDMVAKEITWKDCYKVFHSTCDWNFPAWKFWEIKTQWEPDSVFAFESLCFHLSSVALNSEFWNISLKNILENIIKQRLYYKPNKITLFPIVIHKSLKIRKNILLHI